MLAGIMYPPFLDASLPYMMTAAPYGMVVGHEMTHGFDNSGRLFDGVGAYRNWWSNASAAEFDARAQCLVDQYSGYSVAGMHVDGEQTLGENIADNGGIGIAFDTYRRVATSAEPLVSGLTNDQLFFVAFAQTWCEVALDIAYWQQILVDAHSPAPFRVLGPLSNLPAFAQAFQCSASSVYGRSLTPQRCQVW
jgi:predicted metalloendopeptidase